MSYSIHEKIVQNYTRFLEVNSEISRKYKESREYRLRFYRTLKDSILLFEGREFLVSERAAFLICQKFGKELDDRSDIDLEDTEIIYDLAKTGCTFLSKF